MLKYKFPKESQWSDVTFSKHNVNKIKLRNKITKDL